MNVNNECSFFETLANRKSRDEVIRLVTNEYLNSSDFSVNKSSSDIQEELLQATIDAFELHNMTADKGQKWKIPDSLFPSQIADIITKKYHVCSIACAGENGDEEYDLLGVYQEYGSNKGIYLTSDRAIRDLIRQFKYVITKKEIDEVVLAIRDTVPRKERCTNRDLIAVNNGIFNYQTKQLMDFTPEYIFIAKSRVNYNPNAFNVIIHNSDDGTDWDVESWMNELSDDTDVVNLLWEILGAIIRPHVRWNKSAWFYSETGNNGKGTLCELMRNLCGKGTYASIPLSDFGKEFMLEPLTRATAIIVDENDVGIFIDKAANLKAIITNDVIPMNRKFKTPISYQFFGFMVQCVNEFPRVKDRSDSFYRRQLFVPFNKCFTGHERRYIKDDYLHREEVLEYVLFRVLNMNYYELSEPGGCVNVLDEYKEFNDPIRQFYEDFITRTVWSFLPFPFLYEGYKAWFKKNSPNGIQLGRNSFQKELTKIIESQHNSEFRVHKKAYKLRAGECQQPEYLVLEYDIKDWQNRSYMCGNNRAAKATPVGVLSSSYLGLEKI